MTENNMVIMLYKDGLLLTDGPSTLNPLRVRSFSETNLNNVIPNFKIPQKPLRIQTKRRCKTVSFHDEGVTDENKCDEGKVTKPRRSILVQRRRSEPLPLTHMDYPTFSAWRRGSNIRNEIIKIQVDH
ncbi:unnamed protein product [Anisakis simplex]|uniref:Uncharacterized protein n=1 Tax=Anisakis simplex TaxID=6269 RepID=A0A0M3JSQ6_ANISI|nr:unnamed protein product [Anisakis simplex]